MNHKSGYQITDMVRKDVHALDKRKKTKTYAIFLAAGILFACAYLFLCMAVKPGRILPNTVVNGVSLGGMSLPEAIDALETDVSARRRAASLTISAHDTAYILETGDLLELDCSALARDTLSGSQKPFLARGIFWLKSVAAGSKKTSLPTIKDSGSLHKRLKETGLLDIDSTIQTTCREEDGQLIFTLGTTGTVTDEASLIEQIASVLQKGEYNAVINCPMSEGSVKPIDIDKIYEEIHTEPKNAALNPEKGYQITESIEGIDFDKEAARKALEEAEEGSTVSVDLVYTEPEITTQDMKEHLFADQLATFTTKAGGSPGRLANIQLAASKCSKTILLSGEEFSFNGAVGEQTQETGFHKANATLGTEVVQAYGGGICQVSTTLFIAALYAGLDIPERWCHTYVSSYAEPGMDAAVAWGELDFKIANNKEYPIRLDVSFEGGNLTVTIWGTVTDETPVEIETKILSSSSDSLEVQTCRKIYSADKENAVISRFYSSYINPSVRQD